MGGVSTFGRKGYLEPGKSVAFLPLYPIRPTLHDDASAVLKQEKFTNIFAQLKAGGRLTISLDSAILESGQFYGPDTRRDFTQNQAAFTAWHDVDVDVQSKLASSDSFESIAASLSLVATQPDERTPTTIEDWTARKRADHARRLLGVYRTQGVDALRTLIAQQLQTPMILVHR